MAERGVYDHGRLRAGLREQRVRLHAFPRLRSTNDHAAELRRRGMLFAPAVVVTACQTAGRGRGGSAWWSPRGGPSSAVMTATFALAPHERLAAQHLPLVAGLAVRGAAAELAGEPGIALKWPNDVYHGGRKLAGLLCERVEGVDLVGVGLNVNLAPARAPRGLRGRITSLRALAGRELDATDVLLTVARHLLGTVQRLGHAPPAALIAEYERHHLLAGRRVAVTRSPGEAPLAGTCSGLDGQGRLVVRSADGARHALIAGHVELLP